MNYNVLALKSTAHTFSVGIFNGNNILANERDTFTTIEGGMIPNKVAEFFNEVLDVKILDVKLIEEQLMRRILCH